MSRQEDPRDEAILRHAGVRVYQLRQQRGWTMRLLARKAGVHQQTVYHVESGRSCTLTTLVKLTQAFRLELRDVIPNIESCMNLGKERVLDEAKTAKVVSGINQSLQLF